MGVFYYIFKGSGSKHRHSSLLQILWHLMCLSMFALMFNAGYFYQNNFLDKSSTFDVFASALLNAVFRHVYGIILGLVLVGIFLGYGHFLPKLFKYGIYRVLGRLTFSVYLCHFCIVIMVITKQKFPIEINGDNNRSWFAATYVLRWVLQIANDLCNDWDTLWNRSTN